MNKPKCAICGGTEEEIDEVPCCDRDVCNACLADWDICKECAGEEDSQGNP
jgi:hypothetical protein